MKRGTEIEDRRRKVEEETSLEEGEEEAFHSSSARCQIENRCFALGNLGSLKGTEIATCRSAEGRRCSQTVLGEREWWILMGRRNENSRFSRVFSRLELLICQSRYEYVNRIVAKRRNEGDFEVRNCIVMGYVYF